MEPDQRSDAFHDFVDTKIAHPDESTLLQNNKLPSALRVCVIGASTGIGEHIAYAYAAAGITNLLITSRNQKDLEPVIGRISQISSQVKVTTVSVDIADDGAVSHLASHVKEVYKGIDVLVLNAGYSNPNAVICEAAPQDVQDAFATNALGTYHVIYHLTPLLVNSGKAIKGQFLAIGSGASALRKGPFSNPGYSVSKMAQARMMEYLAERFDASQLFCVTVDPGTVATRMAKRLVDPKYIHVLKDNVALAGATCVWLTAHESDLTWLHGRFIYATWQPELLVTKRDEVLAHDLLKFGIFT